MGMLSRIIGLALMIGGYVILPFYAERKLLEMGMSLWGRIGILGLLIALGIWSVVREVRKIIRENR